MVKANGGNQMTAKYESLSRKLVLTGIDDFDFKLKSGTENSIVIQHDELSILSTPTSGSQLNIKYFKSVGIH